MAETKVVHLITKLELGGAQRNTLLTVEKLPDYGFVASIWYGPGGILSSRAEALPRHHELSHLQRAIHPARDHSALEELTTLLRRLRPQILHTHSSKAGFLGRLAAFRCGIPIVVHSVHGFPFSPLQSYLRRHLFAGAEKMAARWTSHFVFVSRSDRDTAISMGLCKDNHSLIRSGFPLNPYLPRENWRRASRRRFGIADNTILIGTIAPFKPQKGLFQWMEVVREVCRRNPDTSFFLAGDGLLRNQLEKAVHEAGLTDRVLMPGFLHDLDRVMDAFDLGLSTALWEGLPQSLVQMRLKRIPLVVSDIPGNNEVIRHEENGFLSPQQDTRAYIRHLEALIKNPELRKRLGSAEEDFSLWDGDNMVRAQADLYICLLRQKGFSSDVQDFSPPIVP